MPKWVPNPKASIDRIPLFPLDVVLFPGEVMGLQLFEERYLLMLEEVLAEDLPIGIVLARQDEDEDVIEHEPESVGTGALILRHENEDQRALLDVVGARRFRIIEVFSDKPYQEALVVWLDEKEGDDTHTARELAANVLERVVELGGEIDRDSPGADDPISVSHAVAAALPVDLETKQRLLEAENALARLDHEAEILLAREA